MAPGSFNAWCKKYGVHKTQKYPYRNWNTELLEPIAKDIVEVWQAFDNNLAGRKDVCLNSLYGLIDSIRRDLKGRTFLPGFPICEDTPLTFNLEVIGISDSAMLPFLESLPTRKEHLRRCLNLFSERVEAISRSR